MDSEQSFVSQEELKQALARTASLDFTKIRRKLLQPRDKPTLFAGLTTDWTEQNVGQAEQRYREFLALAMCYPDVPLCPSGLIDEFWHAHILDTHQYAEDCTAVVGRFLHHYPHAWLDEKGLRHEHLTRSAVLIEHHFGYKPSDEPALSGCHEKKCRE